MNSIDPSGAELGSAFGRRVLLRQALVGIVAYMTVGLLAPWSLMLESQRLSQLWLLVLEVGSFGVIVTMVLSIQRMRDTRTLLRTAALEPEAVQPANIGALAGLPLALTVRFAAVGAVAAALMGVPGIRPQQLDDARAISLSLLTFTIIAASGVAHYVAVRAATTRAAEQIPLRPITTWLERDALRLAPRRRVARRILLSVVAPVALVGVGTVLVAQAHMRALAERTRRATAEQVLYAALDPLPGAADSGRDDAIAAAAAHGFIISPLPDAAIAPPEAEQTTAAGPAPHQRLSSGQLQSEVAFLGGRATVRYTAQLAPEVVTSGVWLALLAVLLAALLGGLLGRVLAADLVLATQQVASLGTDAVLRGEASVAGRARFAVVAQLGRSVEAMTERFRVFAAAQERALQAKATAQRMKQLLFASVSHDLKSPLNAILGFAELVRDEPLTPAQAECLDMVSGRGRELLALIETILDAARVEEGQLELAPVPTDPDELVADAIAKAHDLHGDHRLEIIVEMARRMPALLVDVGYTSRAVAVLLAHAMETAVDARGRAIRIRGSLPEGKGDAERDMARLHIEYVAPQNRPSLLESQLRGNLPSSTGRGMVLRLGLARAIIELHGGRVEVERGPHGAAVVTCWLPIAVGYTFELDDAPTRIMAPRAIPDEVNITERIDTDDETSTTIRHRGRG